MTRSPWVLALASLWLTYGFLHFVMHDETVRQVPPYFSHAGALATVTGLLELALGTLLLFDRTRGFAARALLVLLLLYVPALVHMFTHDILPPTWPPALRVFMRATMFPHHALLIVWLARYAGRSPASSIDFHK